MELSKIKEAAERFGTPLYLFDLDCIRERVQSFRDAFEGEIELTYSMKTNPFLTLEMSKQVERIEVCSMGEFRICRDLAIPAEKLYISGVLKIREDLMEILEYGQDAARYTAESPLQLQMLSDWADAHDKTLRIYPRLTNGSQFGMEIKEYRCAAFLFLKLFDDLIRLGKRIVGIYARKDLSQKIENTKALISLLENEIIVTGPCGSNVCGSCTVFDLGSLGNEIPVRKSMIA